VPNTNVLVTDITAVNPPVPVTEKLLAFAMLKTVVAAVVCANAIVPVPNAIARTPIPVELKIPVVRVNPSRAKVPAVRVVVTVAAVNDKALPRVVVAFGQFTVNETSDLPLVVTVPVPIVVTVNPVYVPVEDSVKPLRLIDIAASVNPVVPKSNLPSVPELTIVATAVPLPVNVRFGALVAVPPTVGIVNVLVIAAEAVNPPVPETEKFVAVLRFNTVVPAVVCANTILPVLKAIARTPVPSPLNIPVVRVNPAKFSVPATSVYVPVAVSAYA
jgi:hypothetical protein